MAGGLKKQYSFNAVDLNTVNYEAEGTAWWASGQGTNYNTPSSGHAYIEVHVSREYVKQTATYGKVQYTRLSTNLGNTWSDWF